ncbi:hypothetical protein EDD18DRAFT_1337889 [Armillaria luteobubalina]|uniref:Uncharacterized protein n=1 Tax=Armillaria luteobubalina TaxID=153913 RepID=A0AA39UG60_9AGAR|nr:hypothetical protein EDD18DRAFT_1337889 [Armillaria luteobubalina]
MLILQCPDSQIAGKNVERNAARELYTYEEDYTDDEELQVSMECWKLPTAHREVPYKGRAKCLGSPASLSYNFNIDSHITARKYDEERRQGLVEHRQIKNASPRHVWDLHANRAAFQVAQQGKSDDRRGTTCQEWDRREALRKEEWKFDVPTIGCVYLPSTRVLCYLSGLACDYKDGLCWFNRAWILPEISDDMLIGVKVCDDNSAVGERFIPLASLHQARGLTAMYGSLDISYPVADAKTPMDSVAGLVCLFDSKNFPAIQFEEDAQTELANVAPNSVTKERLPNPRHPLASLPPRMCRTQKDMNSYGSHVNECTVRDWPTHHSMRVRNSGPKTGNPKIDRNLISEARVQCFWTMQRPLSSDV